MSRIKEKSSSTAIAITMSVLVLSGCSTMNSGVFGKRGQSDPTLQVPTLTTPEVDDNELESERLKVRSAPIPTHKPAELPKQQPLNKVKLLTSLTASAGDVTLSNSDQAQSDNAEKQALGAETGDVIKWKGGSGKYGSVVPGSIFSINGRTCRDLTHTLYLGGAPRILTGTACQNSSDAWDILS